MEQMGKQEQPTKMPEVSIVIPVYNAERFLWACIDSIQAQTFKDWEVILVDDGSTDSSPAICDRIVRNDKRFSVIHKENGGVSNARNDGIEAATGKYLMFVDADDNLYPTCIEKLIETKELYNTDLVLCGYERFRADWKQQYVFARYSVVLMKSLPEYLMTFTEARVNLFGVSIWGKLYRMDIVRDNGLRFDPEITYEEDCDFNLRYYEHIGSVAAVSDVLYRYRQSDTSLSKAYRKDTFRFLVHGFINRCALLEKNGLHEYLPNLESILMLVVKATCIKIVSANLTAKERLAEYRTLMSFPETLQAARCEIRQKSGMTRKIAFAIRRKSPRLLCLTMDLWKIADQLVDRINAIRYRIMYGKKQA